MACRDCRPHTRGLHRDCLSGSIRPRVCPNGRAYRTRERRRHLCEEAVIPVDQTGLGPGGNCLSACVASVLEIPLAEVPNFNDDPEDWAEALLAWCDARQIDVDFSTEFPAPTGRHVILGGTSPRRHGRVGHAVVALDGVVVHDPHPSRAGIVGEPWDWILLTPRGCDRLSRDPPAPVPALPTVASASDRVRHRVLELRGAHVGGRELAAPRRGWLALVRRHHAPRGGVPWRASLEGARRDPGDRRRCRATLSPGLAHEVVARSPTR